MADKTTTHQGRIATGNGLDAHVAGDYALSAGFGTTATVSAVSADDSGGRVTASSAGTGQGANPTLTLTFKGAFDRAPKIVCMRGDTAAAAGDWRLTSVSTTGAVFTFVGTPVAGQAYILEFVTVG